MKVYQVYTERGKFVFWELLYISACVCVHNLKNNFN